MNERELLAQKTKVEADARALIALSESENRDFTEDEQTKYHGFENDIVSLTRRLARSKSFPQETQRPEPIAPAVLKQARGDNFPNALKAWIETADTGGVRNMLVGQNEIEIRASNATDMNIGTAADGGDTVATGFYNQIIAKRTEMSLPEKLGVRRIPGNGTTVDVPYDNETDGEFVSTAEAAGFDQDAPALAKRSMTLVKYSKKITLSYELLQDTAVNIEDFLADWIARGMAKTMNQLLITEAGTTGTAYKTTATNSAIVLGEMEDTALNATVADYLDDSGSVSFVMNPATYAYLSKIVGNPQYYAPTPGGAGLGGRAILGYPVNFSSKVATIASTAKVAYFGNWNFMGWRESPSLTLLRDPYSAAGTGQVQIWLYFRTTFKQLQADAIGYLKMKT
jgi:HK97 family phage major capsid protein